MGHDPEINESLDEGCGHTRADGQLIRAAGGHGERMICPSRIGALELVSGRPPTMPSTSTTVIPSIGGRGGLLTLSSWLALR